MQSILKIKLNDILDMYSNYAKSKKYNDIKEIEEYLIQIFNVDSLVFWEVDYKRETLELIDEAYTKKVNFQSSLIQNVIESKLPQFENHVTSNKYYNPEIDNPLENKIKSFIIFPIFKNNKVIGILSLWRNIGNKKVFNKRDIENLAELSLLFQKIINREALTKEELLFIVNKKEEKSEVKPYTNKSSKNRSKKEISIKVKDEDSLLRKVNEENETLKDKNIVLKEKLNALQVELEKEAQKNINYKDKNTEHKKTLLLLQEKLEKVSQEKEQIKKENSTVQGDELKQLKIKYNDSFEMYQTKLKEKTVKIKALAEKNEVLVTNYTQLENDKVALKKKSLQSIKEIETLKSDLSKISINTITMPKTEIIIDRDTDGLTNEHCKKLIDLASKHFTTMQHTRVLYELIVFAMHSPKGLHSLEHILEQTGLVNKMLYEYSYKQTVPIHQDRDTFVNLLHMIKSHSKSIFKESLKLNVSSDESVPHYMCFDENRITSIIMYLLIDMFQFSDHSIPIDISISYNNRSLYFDIKAKVHNKNTVFGFLQDSNRVLDDSIGRVCLLSSKKMINYLNGMFKGDYKDYTYRYEVSIPVSTIKS